MQLFDTIVIGLGAMGTAAAQHLAARGQRVLGLEQFRIGHDRGSSHGETRLIRQAYFEDPSYVPLLLRAYDLWDELALRQRQDLLVRNGLVIYGNPETSEVYRGALRSGTLYQIPLEELSAAGARGRWPMYRVPDGFRAAFEPGAGFLRAEACVLAQAAQARAHGADLREDEPVLRYSVRAGKARVKTVNGEYEAARLVVAGGGWSSRLLGELGLPLTLRRMLLGWFEAGAEHVGAPGFIFDLHDDFYYGFPSIDGRTIKLAGHHGFEPLRQPEEKDDAPPAPARVQRLAAFIENYLPLATSRFVRASHCIYAMTPDENFVIDRHPERPEITFAAGFSGHGFKFASVVGEILADLSLEGRTRHPVDFLRVDRFAAN